MVIQNNQKILANIITLVYIYIHIYANEVIYIYKTPQVMAPYSGSSKVFPPVSLYPIVLFHFILFIAALTIWNYLTYLIKRWLYLLLECKLPESRDLVCLICHHVPNIYLAECLAHARQAGNICIRESVTIWSVQCCKSGPQRRDFAYGLLALWALMFKSHQFTLLHGYLCWDNSGIVLEPPMGKVTSKHSAHQDRFSRGLLLLLWTNLSSYFNSINLEGIGC